MTIHESDFLPDLDVAAAYRAQRVASDDQRRILALERRVRELELARLNDGPLAALEAAAKGRELAAQGQAIIDLLDRLKALEARLDGQGRDGTQ
ncbi:hypothetical protein RCKVOTHE_62 [Rhodobacter phage RcKvothe]|nr:hypothetical protein RCKVOTHE_62 [Rhodobacter phage RcKvothe]